MSDQSASAPSRPEAPRVSVAFTFYRVHREALLLAREERRRLAADFVAAAAEGASRHLGLVRPYSLLGTRADADLLLWQAAPTPEGLQGFAAALRATELAPYLERPYHYLSLTRRSMYLERHAGDPGRAVVKPEGSRYLFVYPFVKTRAWYALSMEERQRMMDEHIARRPQVPRDQDQHHLLLRPGRPGVRRRLRGGQPGRVPRPGDGAARPPKPAPTPCATRRASPASPSPCSLPWRWPSVSPSAPQTRTARRQRPPRPRRSRSRPVSAPAGPAAPGMTGEARFLAACRREAVDRTPVWYMRQAGRCLQEYRDLRKRYDILTLARTPELSTR